MTNSYQISESNKDSFPYANFFRSVFRKFVEQKALLNND